MGHLTKEREQERRDMVARGMTVSQIARAQGCTISAICQWARRNGQTPAEAPRGRPLDPRWQTMLDAGMTSGQAAKAIGKDASTAGHFARVTGQRWASRKKATKSAPLAGLTRDQRADARLLVRKAGYTIEAAIQSVTRPRVKFAARPVHQQAMRSL